MAVHETALGELTALNDVYYHDCPDTSSAIIEVIGDFNGEITVEGHALLSSAAASLSSWGKRLVTQVGFADQNTNIIFNDGTTIAKEYQVSTGGQSLRLKVTSYTSGTAFVRVTSSHYKNNIQSDLNGAVAKTAFNETVAASNTLYITGNASYNLIPANFRTFTSGTGTVSASNRTFKVSTGTGVGGYGAVQSFRALPAKSGFSSQVRFSGYFVSSVANSWQGMGLISIKDELSFGYNGTAFGVWHRYGGFAEVRTITVTAPSGGATNLTLTLNDVAYTIPLTVGTVQHNAYEIASWLNANQSIWGADQLNDTVIINALSDGAKSGTYSYSHATSTGTITLNTTGVTKTSVHIPATEWNGARIPSLDTSKSNIYQIDYQNMGFGDVHFYIKNPDSSLMTLVHTLRVSNTQTQTVLSNPNMRLGMYAVSLGSTTNLDVHVESFEGSVQGEPQKTRNPRSYQFTQTLTTNNMTNIITLRNRRTYNKLINQVEIQPLKVTVASESTKNVVVEIRATTDTGVEENFQTAGSNLVGDVSTIASTVTAGTLIDSFTLAPNASGTSNLQALEIQMPPTLNLVIQAKKGGGANADVTATVTWYEDI